MAATALSQACASLDIPRMPESFIIDVWCNDNIPAQAKLDATRDFAMDALHVPLARRTALRHCPLSEWVNTLLDHKAACAAARLDVPAWAVSRIQRLWRAYYAPHNAGGLQVIGRMQARW